MTSVLFITHFSPSPVGHGGNHRSYQILMDLTGVFGKETRRVAQSFIMRNLVHIIASDAHSAFSLRMPVLSPAVAVAAELVGEERARALVKAIPEAILAGEPVQVEPPISPGSKPFWKFWR